MRWPMGSVQDDGYFLVTQAGRVTELGQCVYNVEIADTSRVREVHFYC